MNESIVAKTTITVPANGGRVEAVSTVQAVPYYTRSRKTGELLFHFQLPFSPLNSRTHATGDLQPLQRGPTPPRLTSPRRSARLPAPRCPTRLLRGPPEPTQGARNTTLSPKRCVWPTCRRGVGVKLGQVDPRQSAFKIARTGPADLT